MKLSAEIWESLLTGARVGWLLDSNAECLPELFGRLEEELADVDQLLRNRLNDKAPDIVAMLCGRHVDEIAPFIQTFASPMSAPIRAAALLLVLGHSVIELDMTYQDRSSFHLRLVVGEEDGTSHEFTSASIWDGEAVRHIGLMKLGDQPVMHGYYSFRYE